MNANSTRIHRARIVWASFAVRCALTAMCGFAGSTGQADGQTVLGRVLDVAGGAPVETAWLAFSTLREGSAAQRVTCDSSGGFQLSMPPAAAFIVRYGAPGYLPVTDTISGFVGADSIGLTLYLSREPIPLPPLRVETSAVSPKLRMNGFYERRLQGLGYFRTRAQFAQQGSVRLTDVMRGVAGIRIGRRGSSMDVLMRSSVAMGAMSNKPCYPSLFVDGVLVRPGGVAITVNDRASLNTLTPLDDLVNLNDVEAVEVYRGIAQLPARFSGAEAACGAILVWTR